MQYSAEREQRTAQAVRRQIEVDLTELANAIHAIEHGRYKAAVGLIDQTIDRLQILKDTAWAAVEDEPEIFSGKVVYVQVYDEDGEKVGQPIEMYENDFEQFGAELASGYCEIVREGK